MAVDYNRIDELAIPKRLPEGYYEDRRSVYWVDEEPLRAGPNGHTEFCTTPRIDQLAQHRNIHGCLLPRTTAVWQVSEAAQRAACPPRVEQMANPIPLNNQFEFPKSPYTTVTEPAKSASATPRVQQLAEPKPRMKASAPNENAVEMGEIADPIWPVDQSALTSGIPPRVEVLAEAKPVNHEYMPAKPVRWPVSDEAKNATAGPRTIQLARPKSSKMKKDDSDPYKVSDGAKRATASTRTEELATPQPRKVRAKKVA